MDTLGHIMIGVIIGFASLFWVTAYSIRKDDGTSYRETIGGYLEALGRAIAKDSHENSQI